MISAIIVIAVAGNSVCEMYYNAGGDFREIEAGSNAEIK